MPSELVLCLLVGAFAAAIAAILTWVHTEARTIRRVREKGLVAVMRPGEPCVVMVEGAKIEATAYPLPDGGVGVLASEGSDFVAIPPDDYRLVLLEIFGRDIPAFVSRIDSTKLVRAYM